MNSTYRFSSHLQDSVSPDLTLQDVCRIVTLMKIALKDDAKYDSLVIYLDGFISDYLDGFNG